MKTALTRENSNATTVIDGIEDEADFWTWLDARFRLAATGNVRSQTYVSGNDKITRAAVIAGLLTNSGARFGSQREEAKKLYAKVARVFRRIGKEHGLRPHSGGYFCYVADRRTKHS